MKKCTKKSLPKIIVGLMFLIGGIMKLFVMGPTAFAGALQGMLGLSAGLALVGAWVVGLVELLGGAAILCTKKHLISKKIYKLLVAGLMVIIVVAILSVDIFGGNFDIMSFLKHALILAVLINIFECVKKCKGGKCDAEKKACKDCKGDTCTTCKA